MSKRPFSAEMGMEDYLKSFSEQIDEAKQQDLDMKERATEESSKKVLALKHEVFGENIGLTGDTPTPTKVTNEEKVADTLTSNAMEAHETTAKEAFATFIQGVMDAVPDGANEAMGLDTLGEKLYGIAEKYDLDRSVIEDDDESQEVDSDEESLDGDEKDQDVGEDESLEAEGKEESQEVGSEEEGKEAEGQEQEEETPQIALSDEQKQHIGAQIAALEDTLISTLEKSHAELKNQTKRAETYKSQAAEFNKRQNAMDFEVSKFMKVDALKARDASITKAVVGLYQNVEESKSINNTHDRFTFMDNVYSTLKDKKIAGTVLRTSLEDAEKQHPLGAPTPGQAFAEQALVGLRENIEIMVNGRPGSSTPTIADKILSGAPQKDLKDNATAIGQFIAEQVINLKLVGAVDQLALSLKHEGMSEEKKAQVGQDLQTMGKTFLPAMQSFPDVLEARMDTVFDRIAESKEGLSRDDRIVLREKLETLKPFMMEGAQPIIDKGIEEVTQKTGVGKAVEQPIQRETLNPVTPEDIKTSVSGARETRESLTMDDLKVSQHDSQKPVTQEDIKASVNGARQARESLTTDELKVSQHTSQQPILERKEEITKANPLEASKLPPLEQHESQQSISRADINRDMETARNADPLTVDELKVSASQSQKPVTQEDIKTNINGARQAREGLSVDELKVEQHESQHAVKVQASERGNVRDTIAQLRAKFAGSLGQEAKDLGEKLKSSGVASSQTQTATARATQNNSKDTFTR